MRRIVYFGLLIMLCGFILGCANTLKGMGEDISNNWSTLKKMGR